MKTEQRTSVYGYSNIIWGNTTFTVKEFFEQFPDCHIHNCTHLQFEKIDEGDGTYFKHKLKGAISTSMGLLTAFNTSYNS